MTLFQAAAMWTLRALALWGVAEAGLALYAQGSTQLAAWTQIQGHHAAMARLEERARSIESARHDMNSEGAGAHPSSWRLPADIQGETLSERAAAALQAELFALGAQAPSVNADSAPDSPSKRITLHATWRELETTTPSTLQVLSARIQGLDMMALSITRIEGSGLIEFRAEFAAHILADAEDAQ